MTRVLQMRRGTTAQNDNFTGLAGEVTFDTDKHTLRVHDGVKLGGYELAQTADIPSADDIANANISDATWAQKVAEFAPMQFTIMTSNNVLLNPGAAFVDCEFETNKIIHFVHTNLVCIADDAGYKIGDKVSAFGAGDFSAPMMNIIPTTNGVRVRMYTGGDDFWVPHADTALRTLITPTKWTLTFRLYC